MITSAENGRDGQMQSGLTTGRHNGSNAMIERSHALFEYRVSGVRQTRIDVSRPLNVKQTRCRIGVRKNKGGTLINGCGPSTSGRVRYLTGVQRQRIETHTLRAAVFGISHVVSFFTGVFFDCYTF